MGVINQLSDFLFKPDPQNSSIDRQNMRDEAFSQSTSQEMEYESEEEGEESEVENEVEEQEVH